MNYKKHRGETLFKRWFLNNRFSIVLLNILLFFLIIWVFNKISFVLNPAWVFFSAILPPLLLALIQYYIMNPVVDWFEKKFRVPRVLTIIVLFWFLLHNIRLIHWLKTGLISGMMQLMLRKMHCVIHVFIRLRVVSKV